MKKITQLSFKLNIPFDIKIEMKPSVVLKKLLLKALSCLKLLGTHIEEGHFSHLWEIVHAL